MDRSTTRRSSARPAGAARASSDHDFQTQEVELKTDLELTRQIHLLTEELHQRIIGETGLARITKSVAGRALTSLAGE